MEVDRSRTPAIEAEGRAIVVAAEFPPEHFGGGGAYAASLVRALSQTHSRVDVVINTPTDTIHRSELAPGVFATYVALKASPHLSGLGADAKVVWGAGRTAAVLRDLEANDASVLIAVDYFSAVSSLIEGLKRPKLVLACLQSAAGRSAAGVTSADEELRFEVERACEAMSWTFLCPSEAERQLVLGAHPGADACVVYPSLDPATEKFAARPPAKRSGPSAKIGFVGRLASEKAPDRLLAIARKIRNSADLELVVVTGDHESSVASELRQLQVEVSGWLDRDALIAFYRSLDALLLPSRYETFGLVALEAAAAGSAVVMSHEAGANEILGEHPGVFSADCDDSSQAIQVLAQAKAWRRSSRSAVEFEYPNDDSFARSLSAALAT